MTIDAARAGLVGATRSRFRSGTARPAVTCGGFLHRGRQLLDALLACGPLAVNHRGLRLPSSAGSLGAARRARRRGRRDRARRRPVERAGARDSARTFRGPDDRRPQAGRHPAGRRCWRRAACPARSSSRSPRTRSTSSTRRPGRALKAYLAAAILARRAEGPGRPAASLRSPRDGDARGRGLERAGRAARVEVRGSVSRDEAAWVAIGALAGLTLLGERRSLGKLIERTPVLRELDRARAAA